MNDVSAYCEVPTRRNSAARYLYALRLQSLKVPGSHRGWTSSLDPGQSAYRITWAIIFSGSHTGPTVAFCAQHGIKIVMLQRIGWNLKCAWEVVIFALPLNCERMPTLELTHVNPNCSHSTHFHSSCR